MGERRASLSFRFENGEMTLKELAKRVGVTRQTIIALEAEKYLPSLLLAFRIARAFVAGVEEVFYCNGKRSRPGSGTT